MIGISRATEGTTGPTLDSTTNRTAAFRRSPGGSRRRASRCAASREDLPPEHSGHFLSRTRSRSGLLISLSYRSDAAPVVVVDDVLARALWPGQNPIGERVSGFLSGDTWFTVVGVVSATRYRELLRQHPRAYYPLRRLGTAPPASFLVRTSDAARGSIDELVRDAFANADPAVRVMNVRNMVEVLRAPIAGRRFGATVLLAFAAATLLLAALGVYGVFTVTVQERRRDLGIMRALGAQRRSIIAFILNDTLRVASVGAVAGAALAVVASRVLESLLFGVAPGDPVIVVAAVVGGLAVSAGAALAPALRASRIDPAVALKTE